MDFSEQLAEQQDRINLENDEGVSLLREAENDENIEQDKVQEDKFNSAFESTDLNNTGPKIEDYDYSGEFSSGNSFTPDEEGGINLSNKNIKPAVREIAGHDLSTGERYTSEYESPLITQAISELQESKVNTKTGSPPEDMLPLSKIAQGMSDQDATYEDFVRKTQGPWSDQQRTTAWEGMVRAKQTTTDAKELGKRYFQETETLAYNRSDGLKQDTDETELVSSPVWIQSGKAVIDYFNPNGSDGMDEQEIHDFNLNLMSNFNYNIPMMMFYTNEIVNSKDPELAKSFLFLMDQNDATNSSWASADRALGGIMGDITTYVTVGGSVLVSRLAGASMKAGIRQTLTKIAAVTAADTVVGGAMGSGTDIEGQRVEIAAGEKEEIDIGQAAKAGAISAALTAGIGVGAASIADPALRKFGVGTVKGAIDKINPPTKAPIINEPIRPEQPAIQDVRYKSALRTEVGTLFGNTKKPKMKVSRLVNEVKAMVNNGTVKVEEVNWSGLKDLDPKSTIDRAEVDAILKNNIPVPSLDKTTKNSFAEMSLGGSNYREYVINVDKVGKYGGPEGHFSGQELEKGGVVGDQANVGHLRMEDVEHNSEVGTMFLEGQSDIRKVQRQYTFGRTKTAKDIRKSEGDEIVATASKTYAKARDQYNDYVLETAKKYDLNPQDDSFNLAFMNRTTTEEKDKLMSLMHKEDSTQSDMIMAKDKVDNTRSELNGEPFTPFRQKKSSNSLLFRSAVMEAMNSESPFLAWPKTKQQVSRIESWGNIADIPPRVIDGASEFMVKDMKKLAESNGFKVEEFTPSSLNKVESVESIEEQFDQYLTRMDWYRSENADGSISIRTNNPSPMEESDVVLEFKNTSEFAEYVQSQGKQGTSAGEFYRIKFTKEQRREWGEKGADMFSWGGAAVVGGAAFDQKRNDRGQFE